MAINDVSLTAGMRANLLSLQGTVDLLNRTQNRLSSGKKVNTAIDNPVSFFASQALTARASTIDSLKDAMGQAVQTITAADKGITAISSMIEQAKGIAQSALSAEPATTADPFAGTAANAVTYADVTVTVSTAGIADDDTVILGGVTFAANTDAGGAISFDGTAADLAAKITANVTGYTAGAVGDVMTIANDSADIAAGDITGTAVVAGDATAADNTAHSETMTITVAGDAYTGTGATAAAAAADLQTAILAGDGIATATAAASGAVTATFDAVPSAEMAALSTQYANLLTQLDALAEDSGYKGKNLLSSDVLTVNFEGASLAVTGFNASSTGLGVSSTAWVTEANVNTSVNELDAALVTLRAESSKLSGNLSIITVRQQFSTNMINTLTEGSDKLTLADANEEGANMLMLQTRQSLSTTALSLSAQAAQSVLRLFQ